MLRQAAQSPPEHIAIINCFYERDLSKLPGWFLFVALIWVLVERLISEID